MTENSSRAEFDNRLFSFQQPLRFAALSTSPCTGEAEAYADQRLPVFRLRVAGGHLCEAEAPTEAAAETVAAVWLTEGLLQA